MVGVDLLVVEMALVWRTGGGIIAVGEQCGAGGVVGFLYGGRVTESDGFWRWGDGRIAKGFFEEGGGGGGANSGSFACSSEIV